MEQLKINIADFLEMKKRQAPLVASERADLIKSFVDGINRTRPLTYEKDGKSITVGKISAKAVAVKVGHIKSLADLYYLKSICDKAHDYSKCFFGSLKVQRVDKMPRNWNIPESF
jgi:hypothetical protein